MGKSRLKSMSEVISSIVLSTVAVIVIMVAFAYVMNNMPSQVKPRYTLVDVRLCDKVMVAKNLMDKEVEIADSLHTFVDCRDGDPLALPIVVPPGKTVVICLAENVSETAVLVVSGGDKQWIAVMNECR